MRIPERNTPTRTRAGLGAGFTLFEVLGAVALLGLTYTVLSETAIRGLLTEGRTGRILEASMLADLRLAEIESGLNEGLVPPLGEDETESDDGLYRIVTEVAPFELPPEIQASAGGPTPGGSQLATASVPPPAPLGAAALRMIRVRVLWGDEGDEQSVERVTYGFDPAEIPIAPPAAAPGTPPTSGSPPSGGAQP